MPLFTVCIDRPCESQDGCQANSYLYIKQSVSSHRRVIFLSCFALGGFITLCLLQMNNFAFSFGKKLGKKKDWSVVGFYGRLSLNVFVWKSCTDQCEIYSLLEVVVCSQRHFQGRLAGEGQGLGVFFFFLAMSSG